MIHTIYRDREECSHLPAPAPWFTPTRLAFFGGGFTVALGGIVAYGISRIVPVLTVAPCP